LGGSELLATASRLRYRRRDVWQRRFWEHTLRDEVDYQNYFDNLHFNPVKHGVVSNVSDWPYSSFHHWVKQAVYSMHWGSKIEDRACLDNVHDTGE
jgi:putative transposase